MKNIKVIAFDADDTLWVNEPHYQATQDQFCQILKKFLPPDQTSEVLLRTEIGNIPRYGYGVKSFMLSMIETALHISDRQINGMAIEKIIALGKEMLEQPIELLDNVESVLKQLHGKYRLVMATKGDLLDQEKKLSKSNLGKYFHHIEIVTEKKEADYKKLIGHLDIEATEFLMIGNSLKSDVLPVLNIGGFGFHVPFHTTWEHERLDMKIEHPKFQKLDKLHDLLSHFSL